MFKHEDEAREARYIVWAWQRSETIAEQMAADWIDPDSEYAYYEVSGDALRIAMAEIGLASTEGVLWS